MVNAARLLVESVLLAPLLLVFLWTGLPGPVALLAVVGAAVLSTGIGDTVYVFALRSAGLATVFPVTVSIANLGTFSLAVVLFQEPVGPASGMGAFATVCGVSLVVRSYLRPANPGAGRKRGRGLLLAALTGTLWTGGTLALRFGLDEVNAVGAVGLWGSVYLVMSALPLVAARTNRRLGLSRPFSALTTLAGLAGASATMFYVLAVAIAGAGRAAVLGATSPLFGVILAVLFLREQVRWQLVVGALLAVGGTILVVGSW